MLRRRVTVTVTRMSETYDVIVSGARCGGSSTALLLARKGYRVLVVDRMTFPSDTVSTHFLHPPGVDALERWGLHDSLKATGCPPISRYTFDFGPLVLSGSPGTAYCPRRTVLDKLLLDAAAAAGAEVREGFTVEDVVFDGERVAGIRGHDRRGHTRTVTARVVVGADGKHSRIAAAVAAPSYNERAAAEGAYYAYWSGVPVDGFELFIRPERAIAALPTHDGQTLVLVAWPVSEFDSFRADVEANFLKTVEMAPSLAERLWGGRRESRFHCSGDLPGLFRRPYGPGWALVGDAGYTTDPCTAQGISNAFRDAERLSEALDRAFSGDAYDVALAGYQRARDDDVMPMYELTFKFATLEPPPPEMQQLLGASAGNREAMDAFAQMFAGVLPVAQFFAPERVQAVFAAAAGDGRHAGAGAGA